MFPFFKNPFITLFTTIHLPFYMPYLSFLDKKTPIQNLFKNLRWSFSLKLLTALGG